MIDCADQYLSLLHPNLLPIITDVSAIFVAGALRISELTLSRQTSNTPLYTASWLTAVISIQSRNV